MLNESGTDYIYCVGGSDVASQTTTGRVFRYDPVTDAISYHTGDPWPPGAATTTLPGGFTVVNNDLFILGGFDIPGGNAITDIWQFTPRPTPGHSKVDPACSTWLYTDHHHCRPHLHRWGSDITGGVLTDTTNSFVYDPVADSIDTIAPIPRATGETRALNFNGQMYVMGGAVAA